LWNSGGEASEEKILVGGKRRWVAGRRKEYIKSKETPDLRVNTRGNQRKSMKIMENTLPLLLASGYSVVKGGEGRARWKSEVAWLEKNLKSVVAGYGVAVSPVLSY
jgi:glycogen synthase